MQTTAHPLPVAVFEPASGVGWRGEEWSGALCIADRSQTAKLAGLSTGFLLVVSEILHHRLGRSTGSR